MVTGRNPRPDTRAIRQEELARRPQTDYAYWRANPVPMAPDPTQRPTPIGTTPIEAASQLPAPIIVNNYGYQPPPFRTGASTFTVDGPAGIAFGTFYPATEINQ